MRGSLSSSHIIENKKELKGEYRMPNKNQNNETKIEKTNIETEILEEKNDQINMLQSQVDKLEGMLQAFLTTSNNNQPQIIDITSKIDRPCTLVHMLECPSGLPTVIVVNGLPHFFSKFAETRTFRFAEMQNIISMYREWFDRGVFTLGNDCTDKQEELGIKVVGNQIPISIYNRIETLPNNEFEDLVKKIVDIQRVNLVRTWIMRYQSQQPGYDNLDKIRILNRYTKDKTLFKNGLLSSLLKDIVDEE